MVEVRKAIEKTYIGRCTVTEKREIKRANGSTGFEKVMIILNQPCKLSYSSAPAVTGSETAGHLNQIIKLFIAPEIDIKPGSLITVTQNKITECYKRSGKPAVYDTHQEIILELDESRA